MAVTVSGISIFLLDESVRLLVFSSVLVLNGVIGYRVFAREVLFQQRHSGAARTLVYGAGSSGVQFVTASMQGDTHHVVGYVDDDPNLCNTSIHGRNVSPSKDIEKLLTKYRVQIVVLALPSASKAERKRIIESLLPLPVSKSPFPPSKILSKENKKSPKPKMFPLKIY